MKYLADKDSNSNTRIMQHIETLTGELEGCALSVEKLTAVKDDLDTIAKYLGVTEIQAILFTAILSLNFKRRHISIEHLSKFLACSGIRLMKHMPDLKLLQEKRWIRADSDTRGRRSMLTEISFYVIREVFDRLMNGDGELKVAVQKDVYGLLSELMDLAVDYDKERINFYEMMDDKKELLGANSELPFLKLLKQQGLSEEEEMLFMLVCQRTLTGDPEVDLDHVVRIVTAAPSEGIRLKRSMVREKSKLISGRLLKLQDGMFKSDNEILLTDQAINQFFAEDADLLVKKSISPQNLIKADSITAVKLFFNESEKQPLDQLQKLMTSSGYKQVVKRLEEQNLRNGFTILFHGAPGTGKTEAVYQLARKSNRDVMKVDLSQTKSMWFGESEKKIKDIFNQYRALLSHSERTPILLFNEADGVFGVRKDLKDSATSQTFNTMQNILLEELENFEGILMATTNLTSNFDGAFERRFLYKIEFSSPGDSTRSRIWRSKIEGLSAKVSHALSQNFKLSGGQIENVTRKFHINKILYGTDLSYESLSAYCLEEQLIKTRHHNVGFKQRKIGKAS